MVHQLFAAVAERTVTRNVRRYLYSLGGLGFIPLGFLDSSIIPIPGSMDVLTIILASRREGLWLYYAVMATIGSVMGGFATYRLARKGGQEVLARRFSRRPVKKALEIFGRWGFGAIAIPALLPPPIPMVPFLVAAGAMQYSARKFLAALALGRLVRFMLLAYLADRYGRSILAFVAQHAHLVLMIFIALIVGGLAILLVAFMVKRQGHARA